ncbi:MAG: TIGR01777 family oxidoreductase [Acidobacteria bacterium]|nr:TIGR01777 family oxidoreductase [Acidobacteriota bacterium]
MNFLLTGATGFIGNRLIAQLLKRQHPVGYFTRKVRPSPLRHVGQYYWDFNAPPAAEPFRDVDIVVHLAGEPVAQRWTPEAKRQIRSSRVEGTRSLVNTMSRLPKPPAVLICASAIGLYGDCGDEQLTEASAPGKGFLPEVCEEWEAEANRAERAGIQVVNFRIGIVLGPEGGALKQMLLPFKLGIGGVIAGGQQWMSWIHVDDLVSLLVYSAENMVVGPVNATAPNPVRNTEFTRSLAAAVHRPAIFPIPGFALKLLYGEMAEVLLGSQRVLPRAAQAAGFEFAYPTLDGALKQLLG